MANNLMWLVHKPSGAKVLIGKYYPCTGWYVHDKANFRRRVDKAFDEVDFGHLTPEQRAENAAVPGMGVPHPALGGEYGVQWELEYESEPDSGRGG